MAGGANPAATANPFQQAAGAQQAAMAGTAAAMANRPQQVQGVGYQATGYNPTGYGSTGYQASQMGGPATAASQITNYQNPYENQVVQATLRDIGGAQQQAMNQIGAQATAANAFGGSRHGIAEAESNKAFNQQALDAAARIRAQGFNTALGAAQFDVGQQQNAAAQNMAAQNAAAQFGAAAANQAGQFGAAAANQAGQFGATAANQAASQAAQNQMTAQQLNQAAGLNANQQMLAAANQMGGLGQQSFGYGQAIQNQQMQQGAMQQQMMQNLINAAKQQYAGYAGQPNQAMNTFMSGISGMPNMSGQQQSFNPGLFNYMQLGASMMPTR